MKRIALINDLSGFGKCSLTAAIPVVSVMGLQACPFPTAILSGQTGFADYFCDDYADRMNLITDHWEKMAVSFDGIYSGYLGSPQQIQNVEYFLERFKSKDTIYLADPVMGDNGKRIKIFSDELLDTMKQLTRKADVITPNLTEACLLAGIEYEEVVRNQDKEKYQEQVLEVAKILQDKAETDQNVVITGLVREMEGKSKVANLAFSSDGYAFLESDYTGKSFSGTGDLFASVVISSLVTGLSVQDSIQKAMDFLQPAIEEASLENVERNHGVAFEKYLPKLIVAD